MLSEDIFLIIENQVGKQHGILHFVGAEQLLRRTAHDQGKMQENRLTARKLQIDWHL